MKYLKLTLVSLIGLLIAGTTQAADESFTASIRILTQLTIAEQAALSFPNTESSSSQQTVTVATTDGGAAQFLITGEASFGVSTSIVEASGTLTASGTSDTITVNNFTFGGSLDSAGDGNLSGSDNPGDTGTLTAKIGADAVIPADADAEAYTGTLTFRVAYQ